MLIKTTPLASARTATNVTDGLLIDRQPDTMNQTPPRGKGWQPLTFPSSDSASIVENPPFVLGIIADLGGNVPVERRRLLDRKFKQLFPDNLDGFFAESRTRLNIEVRNRLEPAGNDGVLAVDLSFSSLDDFRPEHVAAQIAPLAQLMEQRRQLAALLIRFEIRPQLIHELDIWLARPEVMSALSNEDGTRGDEALGHAPAALRAVLSAPDAAGGPLLRELARLRQEEGALAAAGLSRKVASLDTLLTVQLNEVLHHASFRRLEGTWRGIDYVVRELELTHSIQLMVFEATKDELVKDLRRSIATDPDTSAFFRVLRAHGNGVYRGDKIDALVWDYELSNSEGDVSFAAYVARMSMAIAAPSIVSAAPALLGLEAWPELWLPRQLRRLFETPGHAQWNALRDDPAADYLVVVLPRLLARPLWDTSEAAGEYGLAFREQADGGEEYCWMSGAFGLAAVLGNAFARDGWCADLRGPVWGRIDGLAAEYIVEGEEIVRVVGPVEVDIAERRHVELNELGLSSIARDMRGDFAAFPCPRVITRQPRDAGEAKAHASRLEHVLCRGRVRHVIEAFMKEYSGVWMHMGEAKAALEHWLGAYVDDDQPRAEGSGGPVPPFQSVRVEIEEVQPGQARTIRVELDFNYVDSAAALKSVVEVLTPTGFLSGRIIP